MYRMGALLRFGPHNSEVDWTMCGGGMLLNAHRLELVVRDGEDHEVVDELSVR